MYYHYLINISGCYASEIMTDCQILIIVKNFTLASEVVSQGLVFAHERLCLTMPQVNVMTQHKFRDGMFAHLILGVVHKPRLQNLDNFDHVSISVDTIFNQIVDRDWHFF